MRVNFNMDELFAILAKNVHSNNLTTLDDVIILTYQDEGKTPELLTLLKYRKNFGHYTIGQLKIRYKLI